MKVRKSFEAIQVSIEFMNSFQVILTNYEQLKLSLKAMESEIHEISTSLSISGTAKSLDDIQKAYQDGQNKLKLLREENDRASSQFRKAEDEVRNKESSLNELRLKYQESLNKAKEKDSLKTALEECNAEITELRKTVTELDAKNRIDLEVHEKSQQELNTVMQEIAKEEQVLIGNVQFVQTTVHRLDASNQELDVYASKHIDAKMNECSIILKEIDAKIQEDIMRLSIIAKQQSDADKQVSETLLLERDIQDNQKARQMSREIVCIENKLQTQQASLGSFNQASIKSKLAEYHSEYDVLVGEVYLHYALYNNFKACWINRRIETT